MDFHADCQLILPTDKRNPSLSLYLTKDGQSIQVFYGLECLEVVPNDPEHMAFRMMVGRLYNADIRTATLEEVFNLDRKTIRSWGLAILSRNPNLLARVMLGRAAKQKRTAAIDRFVVRRRQELLHERCLNYRDTLVREIEAYFDVKLSGETIRQIVNELDRRSGENASGEIGFPTPPQPEDATAQDAPGFSVEPADECSCLSTSSFSNALPTQLLSLETGETSCPAMEETTPDDLAENLTQTSTQAVEIAFPADAEIPPPSKHTPPNWLPRPGDTILCDHVGALIFASALSTIGQATTPEEPLLAQWLGSILLGAVNIEQTKNLNWDDLGHMLASPVRFPSPQREQLTRLATPETIDAALRWNAQQLGLPAGDNDLYYDPHTAHYTGMQSVLKGWCAAIRWADKLINSDYIHTAQGHPIYFECTDNFDDLRARFLPLVGRLRASLQWAPERILTCVIDRGIFSNEVFTQVLADPAIHLVTWEKGYHPLGDEDWKILAAEHSQTFGSHVLARLRNHSRDRRLYHFEYLSRPWPTNPAIRQILVRATNPRQRTVQLSILTDDFQRPIEASVRLMFNRWVQENDFKYLNKHFGINQLTSYRSTPYEQLRDQLSDRQVPNLAYVAKVKIGQQL